MNKSDLLKVLVKKLAEHNLPERQIEIIVDTVLDCITEALVNDDRVEIRGFGTFSVRTYEAKESRNPKTGEKVWVPKKRTPFWRTGRELAARVDAGARNKEVML